MSYVLIVISILHVSSSTTENVAVAMQRFDSQDACLYAGKIVTDAASSARVRAICVGG